VDNIVFTDIGRMDRQVYSCIMMGTNNVDMSKGKKWSNFATALFILFLFTVFVSLFNFVEHICTCITWTSACGRDPGCMQSLQVHAAISKHQPMQYIFLNKLIIILLL